MNNPNAKRRQFDSDSSESDEEVSFNLSACVRKKQRLNMPLSPRSNSLRRDNDDLIERMTKVFELKFEEVNLKLSAEIAPIRGQVQRNSESIVETQKTLAKIDGVPNGRISFEKKSQQCAMKEEKYAMSRRSGRFWPIKGKNDAELKASLIDFLHSTLLIPEDEMIADRIKSVRRTRTAYSSKIKDETLAVFDCASMRDFVFSHAKHLANVTGPKGSTGLRLD